MGDKRCAYCGREEKPEVGLRILDCPVCGGYVCQLCAAVLEFNEFIGESEELVQAYHGFCCRVHLPWNVIEGIKKGAEDNG